MEKKPNEQYLVAWTFCDIATKDGCQKSLGGAGGTGRLL